MYKIYGEMTMNVYEETGGIAELADREAQGLILTDEEERELEKCRIHKIKKRNLLMQRFLDDLVGAFTNELGENSTGVWESYGGNKLQNTLRDKMQLGAGGASTEWCYGNVPEIIGLGNGTTAPTDTDRGLETPVYNPAAVATIGYRNTYNSREQGTGQNTRDNYVTRHAAVWDTNFNPPNPTNDITEVGLFSNRWYLARRGWALVGANWEITFGAFPPPLASNLAWQILNITDLYDDVAGATYILRTHKREDGGALGANTSFLFTRSTQLLRNTGAINPQTLNACLITFSPHVYHRALGAGSNIDWAISDPPGASELPQLYARVVLPTTVSKTATNIINVIWVIYYERLTSPP